MVIQLIVAASPLLIHDAPEAIQCAQAILDFTMIAQYISHNEETLRYMEHALYRLEKTKIAFKQHRPLDFKLYQPTFNYPKFHAIIHFVQCIQDYSSAVNYDTAHSKAVHKYLLKAFYNRANKKEYKSQIWQHNVRHTNIIVMKDVIILEKTKEKEKLSKGPADTTAPAEVTRASSFVDLAWRYKWAMSEADMEVAKELGLTGVKKYKRHASQVEIELDWLHDWIPALATFMRHSQRVYNNEEVAQNMSVRQDIDPEWVSSFLVQLHGSIQCWKIDGKDIPDAAKLVKEHV